MKKFLCLLALSPLLAWAQPTQPINNARLAGVNNVLSGASLQPVGTGTITANAYSGSSFGLSGNISSAAWTTNGVRYKNVAGTMTDTTSAGTVATAYTDVWGGNTIAASSATTYTNYITSYFKAPVQGTNVTFTNPWALGADSLIVGTTGQLTVTTAGVATLNSATVSANNPAKVAGTLLQITGPDAANVEAYLNAFGGTTIFGGARSNGTSPSKTAVANGNSIFGLASDVYDGTAFSNHTAFLFTQATQTQAAGAHGHSIHLRVIPNGSTTETDAEIINQDGTLTLPGATSNTPAVLSGAAVTLDVTKKYSQITQNGTCTVTASAVGTAGTYLSLDCIDSGGSHLWTFKNSAASTNFTFTTQAGTMTILVYCDGTNLNLVGGSPNAVDLTADTTPAATKLVITFDPTSGAPKKSTIGQIQGNLTEKLAVFSVDGGGSAITTGTVAGTVRVPFGATITGWSITSTGATGTNTVKFWKHATATAIPVIGDSINTSGVSLTTGTAVNSSTLSDFTTTTVTAADMIRCAVNAVDGTATDITVTLYGTR